MSITKSINSSVCQTKIQDETQVMMRLKQNQRQVMRWITMYS